MTEEKKYPCEEEGPSMCYAIYKLLLLFFRLIPPLIRSLFISRTSPSLTYYRIATTLPDTRISSDYRFTKTRGVTRISEALAF